MSCFLVAFTQFGHRAVSACTDSTVYFASVTHVAPNSSVEILTVGKADWGQKGFSLQLF